MEPDLDDLFYTVERAKQELQTTIDAIAEGVALFNIATFEIARANWPLAKMYQTSPHQLVGVDIHELLCGCTAAQCRTRDHLHAKNIEVFDYFREDTQQSWVLSVYPLLQNHIHERSVLVIRDTTDLRQAEEDLRNSEARYRGLFDGLPIGLYLSTLKGEILDCNPALVEMLRYPDKDTLKEANLVTVYATPQDRQLFEAALEKEALIRGFETQWKRFDGQTIWVRETAHAIRDAGGSIRFYEGSVEDITDRKRAEDALRKTTADIRSLSQRLENAKEEERQKLSQELHDQVGQNLTALNINLNVVKNMLKGGDHENAAQWIEDSIRLVTETTDRTRNLMTELHPPLLDEYGLLAALKWVARQFEDRTSISTQVFQETELPELPPTVSMTLFRITQEALHNVAKHAQAQKVSIQIKEEDGRLLFNIADDGCGFDSSEILDPSNEGGWGIHIMQERARSIGGGLEILSTPGKGTRVIVEVEKEKP